MSALKLDSTVFTAFGQMVGIGGAAGSLAHKPFASSPSSSLSTLRAQFQSPPQPSGQGPKVPQIAHTAAAANASRQALAA